jgi:DNA-binding transcriptional regulator YiaG
MMGFNNDHDVPVHDANGGLQEFGVQLAPGRLARRGTTEWLTPNTMLHRFPDRAPAYKLDSGSRRGDDNAWCNYYCSGCFRPLMASRWWWHANGGGSRRPKIRQQHLDPANLRPHPPAVGVFIPPFVSERLRIQRGAFLVSRASMGDERTSMHLKLPKPNESRCWIHTVIDHVGKPGAVSVKETVGAFRVPGHIKPELKQWLDKRTGLTSKDVVLPPAWHRPHLDAFCAAHSRSIAFVATSEASRRPSSSAAVSREFDAERLRRRMHELGLSQVELATQLNVRQASVSRWLRGDARPTARYRSALEKYLG